MVRKVNIGATHSLRKIFFSFLFFSARSIRDPGLYHVAARMHLLCLPMRPMSNLHQIQFCLEIQSHASIEKNLTGFGLFFPTSHRTSRPQLGVSAIIKRSSTSDILSKVEHVWRKESSFPRDSDATCTFLLLKQMIAAIDMKNAI